MTFEQIQKVGYERVNAAWTISGIHRLYLWVLCLEFVKPGMLPRMVWVERTRSSPKNCTRSSEMR